MKLANFRTRIFTAIFFGLLMIASVLLGPLYFAGLMLIVFILGMSELFKLVIPSASTKLKLAGSLSGSLIFLLIFAFNYGFLPGSWLWILPCILFIPVLSAMFDPGNQSVNTVGTTIAGVAYLAVPFALFASLSLTGTPFGKMTGSEFVLMFLIILWIYDSGAYIIGSLFGKNKLSERLSPGKTWEGCLGGLVLGIAAAWIISIFYTEISLINWMVVALLIMVFGTLGDLAESMLKRNAGVKDSGKILPGHGGVLDRFDGVLISAPAVYFYTILFIN